MKTRWRWTLALAMVGLLGCDEPGDDLEFDDEQALADAPSRPAGAAKALTTFETTEAYPGFAIDIDVDGDDVVLDWTGVGGPLAVSVVWRSTDPTSLLGVLSPATATNLSVLVGGKTFVDVGAASRTQATPTYFYRVVTGLSVSTMVAKVTTAASPGYTKLGLCLLETPPEAADLVASLGPSAQGVYVWDPEAQGWRWWTPDSQPFGDLALPFGGVASVEFADDVAAYISRTGRVPTNEPSAVVPGPGLGLPAHGLLAAPTTASALFQQPGVSGVGYWDPPTQTQHWYYGAVADDFAVTPCMPLYILRD